MGVTVDKRVADLPFVKYEHAGHLKAVAQFFIVVGRSVPFDYCGLESTDPVHQPEQLLRRPAPQTEGSVETFFRVCNVVNGKEFVFFEKLLCYAGVLRHVDKNNTKTAVFQFFPSFGYIADSLPAK